MSKKIVLILLCALFGQNAAQHRCYTCGFSATDSDQSCLTITEDTNIVECPFTYCTIMRQEYLDPSGVVASFTRGCEREPIFLNHELTDFTFKSYYRACTTDLCNIGNGIESISGGSLSPIPLYNGLNLLVPGTGDVGSGAGNVQIAAFLMFLSIVVAIL